MFVVSVLIIGGVFFICFLYLLFKQIFSCHKILKNHDYLMAMQYSISYHAILFLSSIHSVICPILGITAVARKNFDENKFIRGRNQ